jgi:hypothetical protein
MVVGVMPKLVLVAAALGFLSGERALSSVPDEGVTACSSPHDQPHVIDPVSGAGAAEAAFRFLEAQMDRHQASTLVYSGDGFGAYYPGGRMGDVDDIRVTPFRMPGDALGRTSLRIDYEPRPGGAGWAGVYFLYPDGNWGRFPGRNLTGAHRLAFWACADRETRAEFFVGGISDRQFPYSDSLPRISTGVVAVGPGWQRHELDLAGRDVSSVIGGFGLTVRGGPEPRPQTLVLDDIAFDRPRLDEPRLIPSNLPQGICPIGVMRNSAQVYDQALALIAFLARGRPDDLRRAELIARALVEAQHADRTFRDGRLRNAYAGGELIDPHLGATRLPGVYDAAAQTYLEDESAAGTDAGNMAWAALALVQAHELLPRRAGDPYLGAAVSLARWIVANATVDDALGGFSGGVAGFERAAGIPEGQQRKGYRSTEHNIDLAALFEHLAAAVADPGDSRGWRAQAMHARAFVDRMRTEDGFYWTGTSVGTAPNKDVIPLDVQTWRVLGAREPQAHAGALDWALGNCTEAGRRDAFDFNCHDGDGAWWEGTAQVAAALARLRREEDAAPILARLRAAQFAGGPAGGAVPAASRCGLTTGFYRTYRNGETLPVRYSDWPHIGATAWFIFAMLGVDPFFLPGTAAAPR